MMSCPNPHLVRTILENLSEAVCAFDLQGRITYWNRGAERLSGFAAQDVLGKCCGAGVLVHIDDRGQPLCGQSCLLDAAMRQRKTMDANLYIQHKGGHRVPVDVRFAPLIDDDDVVVGALQVFREGSAEAAVTERIRELEKLSFLDSLTNLANRRYIDMTIRARYHALSKGGAPFGVVLLDIDNLKEVNDGLGHDAGDMVLQAVAKTLLHGSRPFDVKGRFGGDEFIAILANVDQSSLAQAAERFRSLIEATSVRYGDRKIKTTVSVGATMAVAGEDERSLIRRADRELYRCKSAGKNRASAVPEDVLSEIE